LASFVAVIIFSRELGAAPLGTYYPFVALLGILAIPADFGIGSAAQKRISEGEDASQYLSSAIALKLPILAVVSFLIIAARGYVNQYLGASLAIPFVATLIVSQGAHLAIGVLRGELRVGETAIIEVLQPFGWLVFGYALYTQEYGVYALIYGHLIGSVLMLVVGWWKVSISITQPTIEHTKSLFEYGKYSTIASVGGYFYSWMDVAILSLFVSLGVVSTRAGIGAYENAWRLSLVVMILTQAISTSIFPQFSQWAAEDAIERIEGVLHTALLPGIILTIPAFVGTLILSEDLLSILYGPKFTIAGMTLIILAGEKIFQSIHSILGRVLWGIDRPDVAAYMITISIATNLILNVILIWQFGIVGAAVATTGASIVLAGLQLRYVRRYITIDFPLKETAWSIVASCIMGGAIHLAKLNIEIDSLLPLFSLILFGVLIYVVVILLYSPIRITIQQVLNPILSG
ncbi:polysaccharide biosynthesis C-terminal domain-containing protein, partial [Halobacterium sp. MBLA0001]|uniref:oligosaccharide flippase family protein n=1 Tax=Halobacterium sp. MBLA0001 TaxID=3413511 RepID=UPI003C77495C